MSGPAATPRPAGGIRALLSQDAETAASAWAAIIREVHRETPGCASRALQAARDPRGRSSYQALAEQVPPDAGTILDVGCGDGVMLSLLCRQDHARVLGIDLSWQELARARSRFGAAARTAVADAGCLPIRSDVLDAAVCHMTLMLLADLPGFLTRLSQSLRPSGTFAAVVQSSHGQGMARIGPAAAECGTAVRSWWQRRIGPAPDTQAGAILAGQDSLNTLFARAGFTTPVVEPLTVSLRATPDRIWADYLANLYLIRTLTRAAADELRDIAVRALVTHADSAGQVEFGIALDMLTAWNERGTR